MVAFAGRYRDQVPIQLGHARRQALNLLDHGLYNYTDDLPSNIENTIYHFRNFSEVKNKDEVTRTPRASLLAGDHVSEKDADNEPEFMNQFFAKPFGQLSILLHEKLDNNFTVAFAARSTYWRYILVSGYLQELNRPAIMNKSTQAIFDGPVPVKVHGNRVATAFVSKEPITLTSMANRSFSLLENYEEGNDRYRVVISVLPNPDARVVSEVTNGQPAGDKKNYSEIIL